jgi:arabinoxylan arabinofuranohydrolase
MKKIMNKLRIGKLVAGVTVAVVATMGTVCHADNPVVQTCFTADPAPMVYSNTVYLYTGHDEDDATGFKMFDWKCYTSTDMVNWTDRGAIASTAIFSWAVKNSAWACQCVFRNGKFYLYCPVSQKKNGTMSIAVAVADNPTGPFVDALGKPLIARGRQDIDPTVFIDEDGQAYLYWGNPDVYYVKLNKDMISYSGDVVKEPSKPKNYQEGPWFYKRNGLYYLAYASTCCPEGIGYCMSTNATGPWTYKGMIMNRTNASSGNHPGIIDYKGGSYVFGFNYALNFALTPIHRERRSVCVAKFDYNDDGTIPTLPFWENEGVPQIGTFNPYVQTEAATICRETGVTTKSRDGGRAGVFVSVNTNGAYIKIKGVDFGSKGATKFFASVASATKGSAIELRLDCETGTLIGTLKVKPTGALVQWKTQSRSVKKTKGVHDLYLKFTGGSEPLINFDWWKFE